MTPQDLAKAYAETINGPANGWGQHVHPTLGVSHGIMRRLQAMVGNVEADRMIKEEMAPPAGPDLVCWEHQANREPIQLSFSIKVF